MSPAGRTRPPSRRRDLAGGFLLVGVFLLLLHLGQGWLVRAGVLPDAEPYRRGVAQVDACRPSLRWAGWVQVCSARVDWEDPARWRPGLPLSEDGAAVTVLSDRAVEGQTLAVGSHRMPSLLGRGGGTSTGREVVVAEGKTLDGSGWWWLPVVVLPFAGSAAAVVGFHAGWDAVARRRRPA